MVAYGSAQIKKKKLGFSKKFTWSIFPSTFNTSKMTLFLDYLDRKQILNNTFYLLFELNKSCLNNITQQVQHAHFQIDGSLDNM